MQSLLSLNYKFGRFLRVRLHQSDLQKERGEKDEVACGCWEVQYGGEGLAKQCGYDTGEEVKKIAMFISLEMFDVEHKFG